MYERGSLGCLEESGLANNALDVASRLVLDRGVVSMGSPGGEGRKGAEKASLASTYNFELGLGRLAGVLLVALTLLLCLGSLEERKQAR